MTYVCPTSRQEVVPLLAHLYLCGNDGTLKFFNFSSYSS
jgi:hypothetical protein